jgi:DNA-binding XRE family transcriptional regulator
MKDLRTLLLEYAYTQAQLGKLVGVSSHKISDYEHDALGVSRGACSAVKLTAL